MESMKDTKWDFALVLRQKYQEEIFRQALRREGVVLDAPVALVGMEIHDDVPSNGYKISATIEDGVTGAQNIVKCKYLIGADGGRSFVRRAMNISFDGTSSEDKWVRIDGVVETNMPKPRSYCAIESPTHGNVLWAALDHGGTRIGFAFTADRQKAYPEFNEEAAVKEAIASVKPFSLSFKQVDWWTIYVVGQRVARNFLVQDCVFLAGDACHTHSSGAAQGMNTGIHDAVNLGWKLSLVLRGLAIPGLLRTYEIERLPNVQKLINYDKDISRLMTMQLPHGWTGDPNADPNEILGRVMSEAATFSSGLGIYYDPDSILNTPGSHSSTANSNSVRAGQRAPDVELQKPGTFEITRLQRETPNIAKFYIAIFAGDLTQTMTSFAALSKAVDDSKVLGRSDGSSNPISWITIAANTGPSTYELLGGLPRGKVFYDAECTAHARYGVDASRGAIFVLRPDGWVATATTINGHDTVGELERYFERFLLVE